MRRWSELLRALTGRVPGWRSARSVQFYPPRGGLASSPLAGTDFVVVDVETTGWQPGQAAITEIGAVRVSGGRLTDEFATLINPGMPVPASITELTGITDAMVAHAPPAAVALPGFLDFASGSVLAAHNAPFDLGFLTTAAAASGIAWPPFAVVDTAVLARLVLAGSGVPDCKLATLAAWFGTETRPDHRALADASATAEVLLRLLARLSGDPVRQLARIGG
ncbi:MAG TPA: exonuclease domain-containing protein [Streptosporangiaceae bacterium]|jgi:DNA polymerase-3 subunit epsilon